MPKISLPKPKKLKSAHIHKNTFYDNTELESNGVGSWFTKVRLVPGSTTMDMRTRYWIEEELVNY